MRDRGQNSLNYLEPVQDQEIQREAKNWTNKCGILAYVNILRPLAT